MNLSQIIEWLKDFAQAYYPLVALATTVIGFIFGLRTGFWSRLWEKLQDFWNTDIKLLKTKNEELTTTLDRVRNAFADDDNLWLRAPILKPERYDAALRSSIPIYLVANQKGGVGKTTVSANLATYFERVKGERVLAIDLDNQGSLTSMLLPESVQRTARPCDGLKAIIGGRIDAGSGVLGGSIHIRHSQRDSRLMECSDTFANFEVRLLLEWLIGDHEGDIRYNLARVLHSQEVQRHFDRVIIDAPPRITTGFVNALCASTHLVVPFVLDFLSAERVGLFLNTVRRMRGQLFPHLELAGVVGTLKGDSGDRLRDAEKGAIAEAKRGVLHNWGPGEYVLTDALIPRKQSIADAAGIGVDLNVLSFFEPLGQRLYERTARTILADSNPNPASGMRRAQGGAL